MTMLHRQATWGKHGIFGGLADFSTFRSYANATFEQIVQIWSQTTVVDLAEFGDNFKDGPKKSSEHPNTYNVYSA